MIYIDRIENGTAVCFHGREKFEIPLGEINGTAPREGDVLSYCGGVYSTDAEKTEARRKEIIKKQDSLFE